MLCISYRAAVKLKSANNGYLVHQDHKRPLFRPSSETLPRHLGLSRFDKEKMKTTIQQQHAMERESVRNPASPSKNAMTTPNTSKPSGAIKTNRRDAPSKPKTMLGVGVQTKEENRVGSSASALQRRRRRRRRGQQRKRPQRPPDFR